MKTQKPYLKYKTQIDKITVLLIIMSFLPCVISTVLIFANIIYAPLKPEEYSWLLNKGLISVGDIKDTLNAKIPVYDYNTNKYFYNITEYKVVYISVFKSLICSAHFSSSDENEYYFLILILLFLSHCRPVLFLFFQLKRKNEENHYNWMYLKVIGNKLANDFSLFNYSVLYRFKDSIGLGIVGTLLIIFIKPLSMILVLLAESDVINQNTFGLIPKITLISIVYSVVFWVILIMIKSKKKALKAQILSDMQEESAQVTPATVAESVQIAPTAQENNLQTAPVQEEIAQVAPETQQENNMK